jgi:hypothetical protein
MASFVMQDYRMGKRIIPSAFSSACHYWDLLPFLVFSSHSFRVIKGMVCGLAGRKDCFVSTFDYTSSALSSCGYQSSNY